MNKDNFTLTFLDKNMRRCEEKDAHFVDIFERDEKGNWQSTIGFVDREAIKKKYAENSSNNKRDELFSQIETIKKQVEEFGLTGKKYVDIGSEEFITNTAKYIVKALSNEDKQSWLSNPEYDHFGRGLWIRNRYIYGKTKGIFCYPDPDDVSKMIFEKVIEILKKDIEVKSIIRGETNGRRNHNKV